MKKLILSFTIGSFLLAGIGVFSNSQNNSKDIAAGKEVEPGILSIRSSTL